MQKIDELEVFVSERVGDGQYQTTDLRLHLSWRALTVVGFHVYDSTEEKPLVKNDYLQRWSTAGRYTGKMVG
eukprot:CAMPEP_0185585792 /NCGR_PEP_ID=MMETSP0434-20130131/40909_1 /TAXON_ID=626734 ORGANISM="Favella taraikaensis, Strain Fe Narragansett Bay" /NCGR_SAMPLE_ID=MMETSP0434 /ASSEMBLY_ACC=CAM_ASM_000379 /LENGTH=71 /DNA_ID=CAMNT_0028206397 /DNA_START=865 /DNA_END=1080 /DNA_ORIENTATION=+